MTKSSGYRAATLEAFKIKWGFVYCVYCGFGLESVLEVAHLDQDRGNNTPGNLVPLCPTCHKMHDIKLIPTSVIRKMAKHPRKPDWKPRVKDAGPKARATRLKNLAAKQSKRSAAAKKAWQSRKSGPAKT